MFAEQKVRGQVPVLVRECRFVCFLADEIAEQIGELQRRDLREMKGMPKKRLDIPTLTQTILYPCEPRDPDIGHETLGIVVVQIRSSSRKAGRLPAMTIIRISGQRFKYLPLFTCQNLSAYWRRVLSANTPGRDGWPSMLANFGLSCVSKSLIQN